MIPAQNNMQESRQAILQVKRMLYVLYKRYRAQAATNDQRKNIMQIDEHKAFMIIDYYVVVFDLCSSSKMLEDLQNQDHLNVWKMLWEIIFKYLKDESGDNDVFKIYKFVGDGFILLYNPKYSESLISFCKKLCTFVNEETKKIIENYLSISLDRVGITMGIEKGILINLKINEQDEFTGKAINVASRLQSSLKEPEHTNKLLVSKAVKRLIGSKYQSTLFKDTDRILRNLYGDARFYCSEIDLLSDIESMRKDNVDLEKSKNGKIS